MTELRKGNITGLRFLLSAQSFVVRWTQHFKEIMNAMLMQTSSLGSFGVLRIGRMNAFLRLQ